MVARGTQPPISCESALVLEADLDLDAVLDDLAVGDHGARLHDFDRLDIAHRLRGGGDSLPGSVAPGLGARPDHLADDDDAHVCTSCGRPGSEPKSCHEADPSPGGLVRGRGGSLCVCGRGLERPGPDLVEARAAVHRPIVAWRERDDGLAAACAADRGMELSWALVRSGALGCGPA